MSYAVSWCGHVSTDRHALCATGDDCARGGGILKLPFSRQGSRFGRKAGELRSTASNTHHSPALLNDC
jgi:hypothetical protein